MYKIFSKGLDYVTQMCYNIFRTKVLILFLYPYVQIYKPLYTVNYA